jgi:hypothetical protein
MSDVESLGTDLPEDILCELCENIFKRAWTGFPQEIEEHQPSIESLRNSVDLGCALCTKVLNVLEIKNAQNPNNGTLDDTLDGASFSYQRRFLEDNKGHRVTFLIDGVSKTNGKGVNMEETDLEFAVLPMECMNKLGLVPCSIVCILPE